MTTRGREIVALVRTPTGGFAIYADGELWREWATVADAHHQSVLACELWRALNAVVLRRMQGITPMTEQGNGRTD